MAFSSTSTAPNWDSNEWEVVNDDGFVYKHKKRRIDPTSIARAPDPQIDPSLEINKKRKRRRADLRKIIQKYQTEIDRWVNLSNTLKLIEENAKSVVVEIDSQDSGRGKLKESAKSKVVSLQNHSDTLIDDYLLQVEKQEAMIHKFEHLCDAAEALCKAQDEIIKQRFLDLSIWSSPHELMASLCED
ncbi:uncharacterized protein LOC130821162 [Amaranthus tricolor]|uniref:uncharacterized protein LOC130821162 n=1 Tax=Amaranthus tricolor TaxID=29722 RepID=UPI002589C5C7|nr:uncharacterized protein LOC130821162 [Amaranthus tricolor]